MHSAPRLMITAPGSGQGKTTVTCAILKALCAGGLKPAAFKCGPDFIDPMFHREVLGVPSRNLDLFLAGDHMVKAVLARHTKSADIGIVEGVMGFYDGLGGSTDQASSWHLAHVTQTPCVLVVTPKGVSLTLAAMVRGLLAYRPDNHIRAVILNQCPAHLYDSLAPMLKRETGLDVLGYLPPIPDAAFESRHLGLVTAQEQAGIMEKLDLLGQKARKTLNLDALVALAATAPAIEAAYPAVARVCDGVRIAVAKDRTFCFYYEENLELLCRLGAEIVPFSPLNDLALPPDTHGLYIGGGYPELFARELEANAGMRACIRKAYVSGIPVIAECGGYLYLQQELEDARGGLCAMAGVLPGLGFRTQKLGRFGYITVAARQSGLLGEGQAVAAHEFHYWDSTETGGDCTAVKPVTGRAWPCVVQNRQLWAGFPHLYFYSNPTLAENYLSAAQLYARSETKPEWSDNG
jgi:cobyrinic acid a,c-diamide synthase